MKGYVIGEIEVTNQQTYDDYRGKVAATVEQYGGKFLVRGGTAESLEGDWPQRRRVIIEFPSREAAKKWFDSPEYEKPMALRRANSNGRLLLLDGV